jgi:hypothetical protein
MTGSIRLDGSVVFWTLSKDSVRQTIIDGWTAVGAGWGKMAPKERTPEACLRDALSDRFPKALIRPLEKKDGFAVLQEVRYRDDVQTACTHAVAFDSNGGIEIRRGYTMTLEMELHEAYTRQRAILKPSQVATSLVGILSHLNAVVLRPTGGIYWLPDASLSTWQELADVVQAAGVGGRNAIYRITHTFDAESVRAVRDAVLAEADREAAEIIKDVDSGELGERALKSRAEQADRLKLKVQEYERILNESLGTATEIAERAGHVATAAKIIATAAA